jgi:proteic killer suppression protein
MQIVFADDSLALIETDQAGRTRLPVAAIKSARRKLTILRAVPDKRSLQNWKSLRFENGRCANGGRCFVRLSEQLRMVFTLDDKTRPPTITITTIEECH